MTATEEDAEAVPLYDGPDPRDWNRNSLLSMAAEDVRAADAMAELLRGTRPLPEMSAAYQEALGFLARIAVQARESLAAEILKAYRMELPGEAAGLATEAVGGIRGDSNSPGDRDHLR